MAKLEPYFGLCPIIDQKCLLGVQSDSTPGQILVTLGKNIAIKFKISSQKQLASWRTKDKFTSPVIYYELEDKYCAVFSESYLRLWAENDENLDKHRKLKFNKPIHTLTVCNEEAFVVFQNGNVVPLQLALLSRKELGPENVIEEEHKIIEVLCCKVQEKTYIGVLVETNDDQHQLFWTIFTNGIKDEERLCINLHRNNVQLSGCVMMSLDDRSVHLVSLWSDGKLYSHEMHEESNEKLIGLIDFISCNQHTTMTAISNNYIAMYGADNNQEGAALVIYNVQFKVAQCKQLFKMFTSRTRLWSLENNLYLCVGQNLAVVPFRLQTEKLLALVGSHRSKMNDPDIEIIQEMVVLDMNNRKRIENFQVPGPTKEIRDWATQGLCESTMLEDLIPTYIKDNNVKAIESALDYFVDISEALLSNILSFLLSAESEAFDGSNVKIISQTGCLEPKERRALVDKILKAPFSGATIVPFLRKSLTLDNVMVLLRYICYLLSEDGHWLDDDVEKNDGIIIDWGCALLDASYQQLLINKSDQKIVETLTYFNELVKAHLCCLEQFQQAGPIVRDVQSGQLLRSKNNESDSKYCIEEITLY